MNENLIYYISKLSTVIVAQNFESDKSLKKCDEKLFDFYTGILRQKGFDVLLRKTDGTPLTDPCVTDYGGNWSPVTLITDYGRELMNQGAGKANDKIVSCLSILMEKEYDCVNDLLKLLLLLKKPLDKEPLLHFQSDLSFSSSDFSKKIDSMSYITETLSNETLPETSLFRRGLHYEDSWMKHFDSKFQLLGEFSKKNYQTSEKMSLDSNHVSRLPLKILSHSRSSSFVFTNFLQEGGQRSDKSLFHVCSNVENKDSPLLDSFVDNPIQHKLPSYPNVSKISLKADFDWSNYSNKFLNSSSESKESNVIKLKRDLNCSHSFSILHNSSNSEPFESNSMFSLKNKKKEEEKTNSSSKDIILGLWEQEVSLIKEFKPELATSFPELRMITLTEFIRDIKYLLTGINSETFRLDSKENEFIMAYGTCLNDVTPESLFYFSKDFIDIGNSYLRISSRLSNVGIHNLSACTSITQAFWKSIFDFLELYYSLILEIPSNINLMSLKSCLRDVHEMITTIESICKASQDKKDLLQSGELLSHLIRVAERTCRDSITSIVFGILKNCCSVYFTYILEHWMFRGELNNTHNEFFVGCRSRDVKIKTRAYYSSFFLNNEKVPSFLKGFEDSIYNCGKSIHFLKLFNPEDKFCQILNKTDYPSMRICFSAEQLEKLEKDFENYEKRVIESCGEKITVKTIKDEEKEKEKAHIESIKEFRKISAMQQDEMRQKKLEANKAKREKQNQELNRQKMLIEEEKKKKKEKEQAEELKLKEEIEKANLARENLINQEKSLMIKEFNTAMEALDRRIIVAEERKKTLKENLNETLNDNQTDKEGNLTSEFDVNSNRSNDPSEESLWNKEVVTENDEFDENSNPSLKTQELNVSKSIHYPTAAAEEAKRNKFKVLKSEFALPVTSPPINTKPPETKPKESMTELERNKRRVLESEFNIIFEPIVSHMSLKSTSETFELPNKGISCWEPTNPIPKTAHSVSMQTFSSVELKPKPKSANIARFTEKPFELDSLKSESTDSFTTPLTETSFDNLSSGREEGRNSSRTSLLLNDYHSALARDSEIVLSKISFQDIFCRLKEEGTENISCNNYCSFLKYLKQSVFIPLRVQERLANDALLKHLLKGENLLSHLNSLRGYFFLNDGEFGRSFTHHTFRSLARCTEPSQFFEKSNLNNIINEALNYTIHSCEPNAQNLSFRIRKMPPFLNHSSHEVLSPFELTYKVEWPLTVILTEKALSKYKMVFKFLLKLKRINWTLNENFLYFNWQFKSNRLKLVESSHFHKIQLYRHAMTQIVITIDDYIFTNGVQLPWIVFLKDLETTKNIDDLYQKHVRYIKDVLSGCFLSKNSEDLLEWLHNLLELALKFHYTAKSSGLVLENGICVHPKYSVLKATFNEFCFVLKSFLKTLKEKIFSNQVIRSHYVLIEKFDQKLT